MSTDNSTDNCTNFYMQTNVINETGYDQAKYGVALSYNRDPKTITKLLRTLAFRDGGHNKFLESICVWLNVRCPRYMWQELDTYRVGMTKQSESTMHTLMGSLKDVNAEDTISRQRFIMHSFELDSITNGQFEKLLSAAYAGDICALKRCLPEGFLQTRMLCTNYMTLRNIFKQRMHHRLPHWHAFIKDVLNQVEHPELLPTYMGNEA